MLPSLHGLERLPLEPDAEPLYGLGRLPLELDTAALETPQVRGPEQPVSKNEFHDSRMSSLAMCVLH